MNISINHQQNSYYNYPPNITPHNRSINPSNSDLTKVDSNSPVGKVECQTCETRRYIDGSNDPGVSFKTPGYISPEASAATVMSHEREHVSNENAKALRNNREILSQSIRLETSICPECGKSYVSGGTTTTVSKGSSEKKDFFKENYEKKMSSYFGKQIDLRV